MLTRFVNWFKSVVFAVVAVVVAPSAFAADAAPDFSGILSGFSVSTIVTAVVAAGGLLALANFSKWGAKKIASFFGG